ncbi:MAG: hypothetical protein V7746_24890 [Halioglobus sp.]
MLCPIILTLFSTVDRLGHQLLLAIDLHEYLIDKEGIAITTVLSL